MSDYVIVDLRDGYPTASNYATRELAEWMLQAFPDREHYKITDLGFHAAACALKDGGPCSRMGGCLQDGR